MVAWAIPNLDNLDIKHMRRALQQPLPGLSAQLRMAPPGRPTERPVDGPAPRDAAVLVLLFPRDTTAHDKQQLHVVLTRRTEWLGNHSGQISFPGGRRDPSDVDFVATALRETREEIGVASDLIDILGPLTELYVPPSNFLIHPIVGYLAQAPTYHPSPNEVAEVIDPALIQLFNPTAKGQTERVLLSQNSKRLPTPCYRITTHEIWGATAMILSELETIFGK